MAIGLRPQSPPVITLVAVTNPILVRNTQTVRVQVTDNGQVASVTLTTGGAGV